MPLTQQQQVQNAQVSCAINHQGKNFTIYGKRATIEWLGLTPDSVTTDASQGGVSLSVQRRAFRRARWLGDSGGPQMPAATIQKRIYDGRSGSAIPGRPFRFQAKENTGSEQDPYYVNGTLSIAGPFGSFVAYLLANRPPESIDIWTPDGKPLDGGILSQADFAALSGGGGG